LQGYRALLKWREAAGEGFDIRRLVDVLRYCNMDDVADVAVSLIERKSPPQFIVAGVGLRPAF